MRRILVLVFMFACHLSFSAEALTPDGLWWSESNNTQRLGYVIGYVDAMSAAALFSAANVCLDESVSKSLGGKSACYPKINGLVYPATIGRFSGITYGQLLDGLNDFYSDYRNRRVVIPGALNYVSSAISGKPKADLETMAEQMRAAVANPR